MDCKNQDCKKIVENAPSILDYLCDDCSNHFEQVKKLLTLSNVEFKIDHNIVRGLDYYTKTVFEFVSENIGAQGTVCGGGRYDGLVKELGGTETCGIGFAAGIERLLLLMENTGVEIPNDEGVQIYVASMGEQEKEKAFCLVKSLRENGVIAELDHMERGIKAQFKYADKIGAKYVGVIGSDELAKGIIKIKNMSDGQETEVSFENVVEFLR